MKVSLGFYSLNFHLYKEFLYTKIMKDDFWYVQNDFLTAAPRNVVRGIFDDDKKNYTRAESEFSEEVALLDDALALFITSLQGGYSDLDNWKDNISMKASVAMATSAFNYLLLARHAVLLGYFPEARSLLRGCHERITRSYLFYADVNEAEKFMSGKKLSDRAEQLHVDKKMAAILKDNNALEILRAMYYNQSSLVHPNLKSISARVAGSKTEGLSERVVKSQLLGGVLSSDLGKPVIFTVIQATLFALQIIGVIFVETSGVWEKEINRIRQNYDTFLNQERKSEY